MPGLVGIITPGANREEAREQLETMVQSMLHEPFYVHGTYCLPEHGCYLGWVSHPKSFCDCNPIIDRTRQIILIFSGEHFAAQPAVTESNQRGTGSGNAEYLLDLYQEQGEDFLHGLNGWFAGVLIDLRRKKILLFNDRYGVHRIYCTESRDAVTFASEAKAVLSVRPETRAFDPKGLGEFIGFGSTFGDRTLFSNVSLLPGGSLWTFRGPSDLEKGRYFNRDAWEQQPILSEDAFYGRLKDTLSTVVPRYFDARTAVGVSLTGGLDTRMVMAARPRLPEGPACYTYRGVYRDCFDIDVGRAVAAACAQRYQVIPLAQDFFDEFATHAEQTVWLTDGSLDICGSHEVYLSRLARAIAPVRITGNYGSEILRSVTTFKYTAPPETAFDAGLRGHIRDAVPSFADMSSGNKVSFAAFKDIPWHLYGRLAAAQSQLIVRSPYMDNDIVSLTYQAPPRLRETNEISLRLIAALDPSLFSIETDMAYGGNAPAGVAYLRRLHRYALFKAEWYYNAGMPQALAKVDRPLLRRLEPLFLGSHKIEHYRVWFRDQLHDYVQEILGDPGSASRPYVDRNGFREIVAGHRRGTGNYMAEISTLITLELVQRLLTDSGSRTTQIRQGSGSLELLT